MAESGATTAEGLRDGTAIHELTGFQRDLLYVITGLEKPSGQQIKVALEDRSEKEITHGRLYPNLDTLVERDLVQKGEIDRRTNYYAPSERGVSALRQYHDWGSSQLP